MRTATAIGLLVALTAWAYWPVLCCGALVYEDAMLAGYLHIDNPHVLHAFSLTAHLVNGGLVALLAGPIAAGVFLLHPMQTESVAYASNLWELLQTTGILIAVLAVGVDAVWALLLVAFGVWLAIFAKPNGVIVLPLVFWTVMVFHQHKTARILLISALGGTMALFGGLLTHHIGRIDAVLLDAQFLNAPVTGFRWVGQQSAIVWHYLGMLVWPIHQSLDHDWSGLTVGGEILAVIGLLVVAGLAVVYHRRHPMYAWALGWIVLSLSLRIVVPTTEPMHEHAMMVAMVGISTLFGLIVRPRAAV